MPKIGMAYAVKLKPALPTALPIKDNTPIIKIIQPEIIMFLPP